MIKKVGKYHTVYGTWDDIINSQFMIFHQSQATECIVFLFSGMDYGGGISKTFSANYLKVQEIVNSELHDYDKKSALALLEEK